MIEGNLEDISLPGLLQLLAAESTKNYRLRINKGGQHGDVFVCEGHLLVATFGLLEGLDALCEFLNWTDGEFVVEKLPSHFKSTIRSNINLNLAEPGCFSDQCAFLRESNVGLNTEVVPSRTFGTAEWQEALHVQPLEKEDYAILGWITDGRTMRQAMREFQFDLKKTIGVLYRLLITRSVEVVRPTAFSEPVDTNLVKLASKELAKHADTPPAGKGLTVEFHATDIGGARPRARSGADDTASGLRALNPVAGEKASDSQSPGLEEPASNQNNETRVAKEKTNSNEPARDGDKNSGRDGIKSAAKDSSKPDSGEQSGPSREKVVSKDGEKNSNKDVEKGVPKGEKAPVKEGWHNVSVAKRDVDKSSAKDGEKTSKDAEKPAAKSAAEAERQKVSVAAKSDTEPVLNVEAPQKTASPQRKIIDLLRDPVAPDDDERPRIVREGNLSDSIANEDVDVAANFKKQLKKASSAGSSDRSDKNGDKKPHQTQDLPAVETNPNDTLNEPIAEHLDEAAAKALAEFQVDVSELEEVLHVVAPEMPVKQFDERRTDPLPLVSIDIERLLVSTFQITNIGSLALANAQLDELIKQVLLDAERGKTLLLVLTDSNRSESAVLASYRYCLDRGYIEHTDPVMSLTVDLLLGRLELEQYLLQRRRITGDQLRDMVAISNRQGISLDKLLVAAGYMLPIDMERVNKERERFRAR